MTIATFNDLAATLDSNQASALGLPALDKDEIPTCGIPGVTRICTRSGMINPPKQRDRDQRTSHGLALNWCIVLTIDI